MNDKGSLIVVLYITVIKVNQNFPKKVLLSTGYNKNALCLLCSSIKKKKAVLQTVKKIKNAIDFIKI